MMANANGLEKIDLNRFTAGGTAGGEQARA